MANHRSALKKIRQTEKRTLDNRDRISRIKTFIKKFISGLGTDSAAEDFRKAQSEIERGVSRGVIHKNAAARKVSRLHRLLKASETAR